MMTVRGTTYAFMVERAILNFKFEPLVANGICHVDNETIAALCADGLLISSFPYRSAKSTLYLLLTLVQIGGCMIFELLQVSLRYLQIFFKAVFVGHLGAKYYRAQNITADARAI